MAARFGHPADPEREAPVGGGVADRREQQRDQVRRLRTRPTLHQHEQHHISRGRHDADGPEPDRLTKAAIRARRQLATNPAARQSCSPGSTRSAKPRSSRPMPLRSAAAVATMSTRLSGSSTQSTGTSWMRSPLRSASTSSSVSKNQPVSATCGSRLPRDVGADCLETTLCVGEARGQRRFQDQVVAARDDLPLGAAHHPRATAQPGADRQVRVAGDERRHQRGERREVGGQVDIHVRQHGRVRRGPHRMQRSAAPLLLEAHDPYVGQLRGQFARRCRGCRRCWRCRRS